MNVNIYYGGRGLIDDPTTYVIDKIQSVLEELRVNVKRYNLHEIKSDVMTLPQTLKDADGVILATTVEWLGIGGYMQLFLDACWLYGDKSKISNIYMVPVVMSKTYGEREAQLTLVNSWEMIGGNSCKGLCAYVEDSISFELNQDYSLIIEKQAEDLYRAISQKTKMLPNSTLAIKQNLMKGTVDFTPQENEQLSKYAASDVYVKKQKQDIEELAGLYKNKIGEKSFYGKEAYIEDFKKNFIPIDNFKANYSIVIQDRNQSIILEVKEKEFLCYYGEKQELDVTIKINSNKLEEIIAGRMSFQRGFMSGELTSKGDFKNLRMLDQIFHFMVEA